MICDNELFVFCDSGQSNSGYLGDAALLFIIRDVFAYHKETNKLTTHIKDRFINKKRTREGLDSNDETTSCEKKCPVKKKKSLDLTGNMMKVIQLRASQVHIDWR